MATLLFPDPPRRLPFDRAWRVGFRTLHIVAMALILGGLAFHAPRSAFLWPIVLTVASGLALLAIDLWKSCAFLHQAAGVAVLLKLAFLGLGHLFPGRTLAWYLAATVVASIGSHMSNAWRHFDFRGGRATDPGEGP